jgi:hypothetical protein
MHPWSNKLGMEMLTTAEKKELKTLDRKIRLNKATRREILRGINLQFKARTEK